MITIFKIVFYICDKKLNFYCLFVSFSARVVWLQNSGYKKFLIWTLTQQRWVQQAFLQGIPIFTSRKRSCWCIQLCLPVCLLGWADAHATTTDLFKLVHFLPIHVDLSIGERTVGLQLKGHLTFRKQSCWRRNFLFLFSSIKFCSML